MSSQEISIDLRGEIKSNLSNWKVKVDKKNNHALVITEWVPTSAKTGVSYGHGVVAGKSNGSASYFKEKHYTVKYVYSVGEEKLIFIDNEGNVHKALFCYRYGNEKFGIQTPSEIAKMITESKVKHLTKKGPKLIVGGTSSSAC